MVRLLIFLIFFGGSAAAQSAMTGEEFDDYTRDKTLTFLESGQVYGFEQYLSGRRVTWAFADNECKEGYWYEPEPALICFVYEDAENSPQCWNFFETNSGLRAKFFGQEDGRVLYEARNSPEQLQCIGPKIGV